MKLYYQLFFFFLFANVLAQDTDFPSPMIAVDSLYREDQFYFGYTYNILLNRPKDVRQNKFSQGFTAGFLRDFPINKKRNVALALGIGVSYNKYFQNLLISKLNDSFLIETIPTGERYTKNKLEQMFIDIPIEYRWRTSTAESHKFWRVYSGLKLSYLVYDKYIYTSDIRTAKINNSSLLNKMQVGTYLALGRNTLNFYAFYGWTSLFKSSAKINQESVDFNTLNIGMMFYIL